MVEKRDYNKHALHTDTYWFARVRLRTICRSVLLDLRLQFAAQLAWKALDWLYVLADTQIHAQTDLFMKLEIIAAVAAADSWKAA